MKSLLARDVSPRAAAAVVALVLLVSIVGGREKPEPALVVASAAPTAAPSAVTESSADVDPERLRRPRVQETIPDPFAPRAPSPAAAPSANAPPPPAEPQFPFRYLGRIIDGDKREVFLARGEAHFSVAAGQTVDNLYKVEKFTDQSVTLVHLRSGARRVLSISEAN